MDNYEDKLIELETKIAYQDETLLKLNDVLSRQQLQIEQMEISMCELAKRFKELMESASNIQAHNEKPPHY